MLRDNLSTIRQNLSTPKGLTVFITSFLLSFAFFASSSNLGLVAGYMLDFNFSALSTLLPSLITGYPSSTTGTMLSITLVTCALIGVNLALLTNILTFQGASGAGTGTFIGLSISGCTACATGAISIAGASIGLAFLPLNGLELNLIGIIVLGFSALYTAEKTSQNICKL